MTYGTIQPPFTLRFREMSKSELKGYFAWFQDILPRRIGELTKAIKLTPGFESWEADFSADSLDRLGQWFASQVETRGRTEDEIRDVSSRASMPIEIPREEMTNRTFSLAMDTGMYVSQVFLTNHPALKWGQQFGNIKGADYRQPVLVGFNPSPFNPVRLLVTLGYGIVSGSKSGKSLRELYDIWARMIRQ